MPPKKGGKKRKAVEEKYQLVYFDLEGLAEVSRLLFAVGGQEFEDKRYPFEKKDGKVVRVEWEADKHKYPFGKIPVLDIDGTVITQSRAIENFLAKKFNLLGKGPLEAALIEGIVEQVKDIRGTWNEHNAKGEQGAKDFFSTALPESLEQFEKQLKDNKSGFFVGKKITLADISVYRHLNSYWAPDHTASVQEVLKKFPHLTELVKKVGEDERVKAYHEKRNKAKEPKTETPAPAAPST